MDMNLRRVGGSFALVAVVWLTPQSAVAVGGEGASSPNIELLQRVAYDGGSELAAGGRYVYAGELSGTIHAYRSGNFEGGIHIFDTRR